METVERVARRTKLLGEVLHRNAIIIDSYQDREGLVLQHYVFHMLSIPEQLITDVRDKSAFDNIIQHVETNDKAHIIKIQRPMSHVLMKSPKFCKYPRNLPSDIGWLIHLEELSLNTCRISGLLPKSLGECANLQVLILSDNHLAGHIPASLGSLSHLTFLDLSHNHLYGTIPNELGNLTRLAKCYLSHNQLTGAVPQSLGNLHQLMRLALDHNHLSSCVPGEILRIPSLQLINAENNNLTGVLACPVSPSLKWIFLQHNAFQNVEEFVHELRVQLPLCVVVI